MIRKDELLRLLKEGIDAEEKSIPVYMDHLGAALFWVGMEPDKAAKIQEAFKHLASCSRRHKEILTGIAGKVREGGRDAY